MSDQAHSVLDRPSVRLRVGLALLVIALCGGAVTGCEGFFQRKTGDIMSGYAEQHMFPYLMASDDLSMACETGVSMGAFLMSFERVTDPPRRAALVTLLSAGMCAEAEAWESELRQLRAVREGASSEAQDARLAEQRSHALAASRFAAAWEQFEGAFGPAGEGCPELEGNDQILYLLGLSSGMLALLHDRAAGGVAGVSMDIPLRVSRAAACLDDDRWWGGPLALQASVWALVPGAAPEGVDPWESLAAAAQMGEAAGVRLARAFQVQILDAVGRRDDVRQAIEAHAASLESTPAQADWELLDAYATEMIRHVSDRLWTMERGYRTPLGALGTFPEDSTAPAEDDAMFDDLLEGLDDDGESPVPSTGPTESPSENENEENP